MTFIWYISQPQLNERQHRTYFHHVVVYPPPSVLSDEYKMKGVEEVKYMRGDENRVNARNQENLVRHTHMLAACHLTHTQTDSSSAQTHQLVLVSRGISVSITHTHRQLKTTCQRVCGMWGGGVTAWLVWLPPYKACRNNAALTLKKSFNHRRMCDRSESYSVKQVSLSEVVGTKKKGSMWPWILIKNHK